MMKKLQFIILVSLMYNFTFAQLGVNTNSPSGILHIDGAKDNPNSLPVTNSLQLNNDFVMNTAGFIGIGKLPETNAKVSITTNSSDTSQNGQGFRLKDGTEGNGNLLILKNTSGDVVWTPRVGTVKANLGSNIIIPINSNLVFTNSTITLPPGKWLIRSTLILRAQVQGSGSALDGSFTDGVYANLSWADKNSDGTYVPTVDELSGNLFGGAYYSRYGLAFGQTILNNTTNAPKIYYLVTRAPIFFGTGMTTLDWRGIGGGGWGENAIIAFPAN